MDKGENRMSNELDILNHIRSTRLHSLQIRTLLTKKQNAFSRKLAEYILTDEETASDHDSPQKLKRSDTIMSELHLPKNKTAPLNGGLNEKFKAAFQQKFEK